MSEIKRRPIQQYSVETLAAAMEAVKSGMPIREASRRYRIPRTTLLNRHHDKKPLLIRKMGPAPVLTYAEERQLSDWLQDLYRRGFSRKKSDVINSASRILLSHLRKNQVKNNTPGNKWYYNFLRRRPEIKHSQYSELSKSHYYVSEQFIGEWFNSLTKYLRSIKKEEILRDPRRILVGEEMSFSMCPKSGKIQAPKRWKNVYELKVATHDTVSVLVVFSATGEILNPLVAFPFIKPPASVTKSLPSNWFLGKSESGLMDSNEYYSYISRSVNEWLRENRIPKPVLLFMDGLKTHLSLHLSKFCHENGIILYALPPNIRHNIHRTNFKFFQPLKCQWSEMVCQWQAKPKNCVINKNNFCPVLKDGLEHPPLRESIRNGFNSCGLFSFNPDAMDYSECDEIAPPIMPKSDPEVSAAEIDTAIHVFNVFKENLESRGIDCKMLIDNISEIYHAQHKTDFQSNVTELDINQVKVEPDDSLFLEQLNNCVDYCVPDYEIDPLT